MNLDSTKLTRVLINIILICFVLIIIATVVVYGILEPLFGIHM